MVFISIDNIKIHFQLIFVGGLHDARNLDEYIMEYQIFHLRNMTKTMQKVTYYHRIIPVGCKQTLLLKIYEVINKFTVLNECINSKGNKVLNTHF